MVEIRNGANQGPDTPKPRPVAGIFSPKAADRGPSQFRPASASASVHSESHPAAAPATPQPEVASPAAPAPGDPKALGGPDIHWQKGELLGKGAYGEVYVGQNTETGELMAVKTVEIRRGAKNAKALERHVMELEAEVGILKRLDHPNIVRYLGTQKTEEHLHIFLELMMSSLSSLLNTLGPFQEAVVRRYTRQILQGLEYLHRSNHMHRDIKGANILMDQNGAVKLADFGASKKIESLATVGDGDYKSIKGTPFWMAPEIINRAGHGRQADIWSIGCTVLEMFTARPPWFDPSKRFQDQMSAMFYIAQAQGPPPFPDHISPEARDFLTLCFQRDPKRRPNCTRLLQHPFVANAQAIPAPTRAPLLIGNQFTMPSPVTEVTEGTVLSRSPTPESGVSSATPDSGVSSQTPASGLPRASAESTPAIRALELDGADKENTPPAGPAPDAAPPAGPPGAGAGESARESCGSEVSLGLPQIPPLNCGLGTLVNFDSLVPDGAGGEGLGPSDLAPVMLLDAEADTPAGGGGEDPGPEESVPSTVVEGGAEDGGAEACSALALEPARGVSPPAPAAAGGAAPRTPASPGPAGASAARKSTSLRPPRPAPTPGSAVGTPPTGPRHARAPSAGGEAGNASPATPLSLTGTPVQTVDESNIMSFVRQQVHDKEGMVRRSFNRDLSSLLGTPTTPLSDARHGRGEGGAGASPIPGPLMASPGPLMASPGPLAASPGPLAASPGPRTGPATPALRESQAAARPAPRGPATPPGPATGLRSSARLAGPAGTPFHTPAGGAPPTALAGARAATGLSADWRSPLSGGSWMGPGGPAGNEASTPTSDVITPQKDSSPLRHSPLKSPVVARSPDTASAARPPPRARRHHPAGGSLMPANMQRMLGLEPSPGPGAPPGGVALSMPHGPMRREPTLHHLGPGSREGLSSSSRSSVNTASQSLAQANKEQLASMFNLGRSILGPLGPAPGLGPGAGPRAGEAAPPAESLREQQKKWEDEVEGLLERERAKKDEKRTSRSKVSRGSRARASSKAQL